MTTAELEVDYRIGSTTPRIYTPPLEENCTGPADDPDGNKVECPCGCGLNPKTSWGFDFNWFVRNVLKWKWLPWQEWLGIHALEKNADGGFRFKILLILVARQNGKTFFIKALGLWRLFISRYGRCDATCPGARLAIIACQNLDYSEEILKSAVDEVRDNRLLSRELINHRVTNGKHRMILTNRRHWRAATANRKGGRSLSVDLALMDELREHVTWDAWNAIAPTTLVRPFSQIVATSNAGDQRSEVLRALRDGAVRRVTTGETIATNTGIFEWSVPMDEDPRDNKFWYMANPALGRLNDFSLSDLQAMFESMEHRNMPGFRTEYLALDVLTPILTTTGWKTIGDISVGDHVFAPDGHPVRVIHTTPVYAGRPCYEVMSTDGRSVICDADHKWEVTDRRRGGGSTVAPREALSTRELLARGLWRNKTGGKFAYKLPRQHAIVSKPIDLPIDPYLLGYWLGDGSATKSEITCAESDADELTSLLPAHITTSRRVGNARYISFRISERGSKDGFASRCRALGVWTAADKHIPSLYVTAGTEQRLALLQGLCDSDGSIDTNGRVRFATVRLKMAEQVQYLARSLGWRATITAHTSKFQGRTFGESYVVAWTHDASEPAPFRLSRKLARVQTRPSRSDERVTSSIRSITPVSSRLVRCITVDSADNLFVAGTGLLPTHNCQWVDAMQPGVMPAEHWADTLDPNSRRKEGAKVYACVDVNYDRSRGYVAVAARRADGHLHIEVIAKENGTDWIIPYLKERKSKFAGVAVQKTGAPVSGMIEDMRKEGINVVEWGPAQQVATGCHNIYDGVTQHRVFHRPAPLLDRAAASGVSRSVSEGWVFDRRNSPVDVSPLIACTGAAWLEHNPKSMPAIHEWPDEDVLKKWEEEADEQFGSLANRPIEDWWEDGRN